MFSLMRQGTAMSQVSLFIYFTHHDVELAVINGFRYISEYFTKF